MERNNPNKKMFTVVISSEEDFNSAILVVDLEIARENKQIVYFVVKYGLKVPDDLLEGLELTKVFLYRDENECTECLLEAFADESILENGKIICSCGKEFPDKISFKKHAYKPEAEGVVSLEEFKKWGREDIKYRPKFTFIEIPKSEGLSRVFNSIIPGLINPDNENLRFMRKPRIDDTFAREENLKNILNYIDRRC